jgi:hypothetical protein
MPPTALLIMIGIVALPSITGGVIVGVLAALAFCYRRELLVLLKGDRAKPYIQTDPLPAPPWGCAP